MKDVKAEAIRMIEKMSSDCTWEQVAYRMFVRAKVEEGLADVEAGRLIPHEQVKKEMDEWLASHGLSEPAATSD